MTEEGANHRGFGVLVTPGRTHSCGCSPPLRSGIPALFPSRERGRGGKCRLGCLYFRRGAAGSAPARAHRQPIVGAPSARREQELLIAMMTMQTGGLTMAALGWLGSILTCALPMWKVTAFIGSNIVVAQVFWEGLWMNCVYESTGQMQCKAYDSLLELTSDLQAARALVVTSIFVSFLAFFIALSGADCTRCVDDNGTKTRISAVAGVIFIMASIMLLIPVSWSANSIVSNFYNPMVPEALKRELGAALYIGWASSALQLFGGGVLCCSGSQSQQDPYPKKYRAVKTCGPMGYAMKDYV
ncbi:claudin-4-like [Serinus canaria]|uniref:claudin-4-like n=1 Tax=Serinus canaria TaxID=9135 RepID=UPI0021CD064C|nr:claudin-4-like [Serinus canaria]